MSYENEKFLSELMKKDLNSECCDCRRINPPPEWASYNLGIFLCTRCSSIHRNLGTHISKVKHLKLDNWDYSSLNRMVEMGNRKARMIYEERIPKCYRIPKYDDPHLVIDQFIRAKYERLEFSKNFPSYTSGKMEGYLMKRLKEENSYHPRKFILNESEDTLKYHVKDNSGPKAVLRLSDINVVMSPEKIPHRNSLQITYVTSSNSTRHIFVYHDDPEIINNWYTAIRSAKLNRLQIAFPNANEQDLAEHLTHDFAKEGWLYKTGPRKTDAYKKRWFTLDDRKLMYHEDPFDAFPKGEIFLGDVMHGYSVRVGPPDPHWRDQGFSFTLFTPERIFNLSADTNDERDEWMEVIQRVLERPLTPQDSSLSARLNRKRNCSFIPFPSR